MEGATLKNQEFIYDDSPYHLAVKVGITGVLLRIMAYFVYEIIFFNYYNSTTPDLALLNYQTTIVDFLSISWTMLIAMGYLGIFAIKRNRLAAIFPTLALLSTAGYWIVRRIIWEAVVVALGRLDTNAFECGQRHNAVCSW